MTTRGPDRVTRCLLACGGVAPAVAIAAFWIAAVRLPGYDHVADTISKLSAPGVAGSWLWTTGLALYAVLMGGFAVGLLRTFGSVRTGRIVVGAVGAHAVLMAGVAVFRDDLRAGGFFTTEGAIHDVVSGMAFSALVVAMLGAISLAQEHPWLGPLRSVTTVLGTTITAVGIAFLFTPPEVQGVPQRVFVGLAAVWLIYLALRSVRSPGTIEQED